MNRHFVQSQVKLGVISDVVQLRTSLSKVCNFQWKMTGLHQGKTCINKEGK